jgi:hypothetical protein
MAVQGSPRSSIHLTITDAYAKTWGTWEGVREFVQNWYDGVLDSYETCSPAQSPMRKSLKIVPVSGRKTLCMASDGASSNVLPLSLRGFVLSAELIYYQMFN